VLCISYELSGSPTRPCPYFLTHFLTHSSRGDTLWPPLLAHAMRYADMPCLKCALWESQAGPRPGRGRDSDPDPPPCSFATCGPPPGPRASGRPDSTWSCGTRNRHTAPRLHSLSCYALMLCGNATIYIIYHVSRCMLQSMREALQRVAAPHLYLLAPAPTTATATATTATAAIFDTCAALCSCACAATPSYCDW
jgi:hypothetical protein